MWAGVAPRGAMMSGSSRRCDDQAKDKHSGTARTPSPARAVRVPPGFEVLPDTDAQRLAGIERWLDVAQLAQGTATATGTTL